MAAEVEVEDVEPGAARWLAKLRDGQVPGVAVLAEAVDEEHRGARPARPPLSPHQRLRTMASGTGPPVTTISLWNDRTSCRSMTWSTIRPWRITRVALSGLPPTAVT